MSAESSRHSSYKDPTREIAFDILKAVFDHKRMLEEGLDKIAPSVELRDKAAAHRLAACVLRHKGTLVMAVEPFMKKDPPSDVKIILWIGVAQLLFLGTPAHAAVGTVVSLAHRKGLSPFAGLVNAIMRKVAQKGLSLLDELDQPRLDIPAWLWTSWGKKARSIAEGIREEAPLDITLKPGNVASEGGTVLPNGSVRYSAGTRPAHLKGYEEGHFWVQDVAASLPARILNVQKGERVVDLCAAPGGKTAQLACAGAQVIAVERNDRRMKRLKENMQRLHLNVELVLNDVLHWKPEKPVDAILLDAPCSATGTLRRHPDILYNRRPYDIGLMAEEQRRLIAHAASLLPSGGRMVYAVCSLQAEEGEHHLAMCEEVGLKLVPLTSEDFPYMPQACFTAEGCMKTHPGLWADQGGMDGFFIAKFLKK